MTFWEKAQTAAAFYPPGFLQQVGYVLAPFEMWYLRRSLMSLRVGMKMLLPKWQLRTSTHRKILPCLDHQLKLLAHGLKTTMMKTFSWSHLLCILSAIVETIACSISGVIICALPLLNPSLYLHSTSLRGRE